MTRINVTKTFLPPLEEYESYVKKIWQIDWLTNQGPLLQQFENEVSGFLGVEQFHFVGNGTLALQVALRGLDITEGEVITTPFTYVATISSILWERCRPIFVDIDPETLCIDANKIEAAITAQTKAIMPVHVFGIPCDIEKIESTAKKHNIKVIYDAAHAFGVEVNGESLLNRGDISICSFHSTKPFHTIEGGALVVSDPEVSKRVELIKRFGHNGDEHFMLGVNAKANEFQAAMGLCNLKYIDEVIASRKSKSELYDAMLAHIRRPKAGTKLRVKQNYAYYPVILDSEEQALRIIEMLNAINIYPRRYFYPSLNKLPYLDKAQSCPISEDIARRILCLPLYSDLEDEIVNRICEVVTAGVKK